MHSTHDRIRGVSLRELLPKAKFLGGPDIRVTSVCSDAARCRPGDLYVALLTSEDDGHDHVHKAIRRGATAVLCERLVAASVPMCFVPNTHSALGRVCQKLAGSPSDSLRMIGVTGSNGKTVTSILVASILAAAQQRVGVLSSIGYSDGGETAAAPVTTPSPPELADWLARMNANGCENAVVEVSSEGLAQHRTAGVQFDAAILTNIRRDHVDEHGSAANYRRMKFRLLRQLKPHGFAVLNADDPGSQSLLAKIDRPVLTFGMNSSAEVMATVLERHSSEQTFLLTAGNESIPVCTRMIGDHHVYNCLAAAALGLVLGLDLTTVARGLEQVEYVPGRLERIECGQSFSVFVDHARTPDSLAASLKAVRQTTRGRVICAFGAEGETLKERRAELGHVVERAAHRCVITNQNPRHDEPLQIAHDILDGFSNPEKAHILPDRAEAIYWALSKARPGDAVVIAGKGDEDFQTLGSHRYAWDDRAIVRDWLYTRAADDETDRKPNHGLRIVG